MQSIIANIFHKRFLQYSLVGITTFGFDLLLLFALIELFHVSVVLATMVAFAIAVTLNYSISRQWVFRGTKRGFLTGHLYFFILAMLGLCITTLLMWLLTSDASVQLYIVRTMVAGLVGIGNYLLNGYFNFKVMQTC